MPYVGRGRGADAGNPAGLRNVGLAYHNGWGVTKDQLEAALWLRKAADAGDAEAMSATRRVVSEWLGVYLKSLWNRRAGRARVPMPGTSEAMKRSRHSLRARARSSQGRSRGQYGGTGEVRAWATSLAMRNLGWMYQRVIRRREERGGGRGVVSEEC
jgi:TPR repeat protein